MNRPAPLQLSTNLARSLVAEARANDFEICGFITEAAGVYVRYSIANQAARPVDRFDMDTAEQIAAFKRMRQNALALRAIYHSHPTGEATPSIHDRQGHNYPDTAALIVAPRAEADAVRAWRLISDAATELDIEWQTAPWHDGFL